MITKLSVLGAAVASLALACSVAPADPTGQVEGDATSDKVAQAAAKACTQASECIVYETLPCCSKRKDTVNQASLESAKQRAAEQCAVADCAPDFMADDRIAVCEAGRCDLVEPAP